MKEAAGSCMSSRLSLFCPETLPTGSDTGVPPEKIQDKIVHNRQKS